MKKLAGLCLICLMAGLLAVGCGQTETQERDRIEYPVVMYFANSQYIETGDETIPPLLKVSNYNVYSLDGEQYEILLSMLQTIPDGVKDGETALTEKIKVRRIDVNEGTAYVDLSSKGLSGGSLEEEILISQIVNSLRSSFSEIQQVQFMVDGKIAESLMGHFDAASPYADGIYKMEEAIEAEI